VISPAERLSPVKASTPAATCSPAAAVTPAAEGVQGASRFPAYRRKRRASKKTKQSVIDVDVHNMITKLVDEQHEKWPDLLGTVSLAYNCTIHTATGYNPHELFYSFSPSCPLDAQVDAPSENPVNNADAYALQAEDRLRDAFTFMRKVTGRQMERMKRYYDASVKPARFDEGNFHVIVLSEEEAGIILKMASDVDWAVSSEGRLNDTNCVLQRSPRSRPFVVHVDRIKPYHGVTTGMWTRRPTIARLTPAAVHRYTREKLLTPAMLQARVPAGQRSLSLAWIRAANPERAAYRARRL